VTSAAAPRDRRAGERAGAASRCAVRGWTRPLGGAGPARRTVRAAASRAAAATGWARADGGRRRPGHGRPRRPPGAFVSGAELERPAAASGESRGPAGPGLRQGFVCPGPWESVSPLIACAISPGVCAPPGTVRGPGRSSLCARSLFLCHSSGGVTNVCGPSPSLCPCVPLCATGSCLCASVSCVCMCVTSSRLGWGRFGNPCPNLCLTLPSPSLWSFPPPTSPSLPPPLTLGWEGSWIA
jgi:hypothetical protein